MKWRKFDQYVVLRLERDEEIITTLKGAANTIGIKGGFFYGLGVGKDLQLGYFDANEKTYIRKKFDGEYEFTSIMGNIAIVDEELIIHCHATITDVEFNAYGGHLFDGKVGPTIELIVLPFKQPMLRSLDQNTGLKLLKL